MGVLIGVLVISGLKPSLVFSALWAARRLEQSGHRDHWVTSRVLAEVCRGVEAVRPLPIQPIDSVDEEDFPRIRRLIRTLRLPREMDPYKPPRPASVRDGETPETAQMREACAACARHRIIRQSPYFDSGSGPAETESGCWRTRFRSFALTKVAAGLVLVLLHAGGSGTSSLILDRTTSSCRTSSASSLRWWFWRRSTRPTPSACCRSVIRAVGPSNTAKWPKRCDACERPCSEPRPPPAASESSNRPSDS